MACETATHEELLQKQGTYRKLREEQQNTGSWQIKEWQETKRHPLSLPKSRDSGCRFFIGAKAAQRKYRDYFVKNLEMQKFRHYNANEKLVWANQNEIFSDIWNEGVRSWGMYESKISNARWIAYGLPGNVGWISFLVALGRFQEQKNLNPT